MTDAADTLPQRFNMAAYAIGRAATARPKHPALIVMDAPGAPPAEVWTFADLEDAVLRIAGGLQAAGLTPGDRILIRLENTSAYALTVLRRHRRRLRAAADLGPAHRPRGAVPARRQRRRSRRARRRPRLDAVPAASCNWMPTPSPACCARPRAASYADTAADDPAFLIYTSGTTAPPKGVLHAQRSAFGRRPMYQGWYGIGPDDRMLHAGAFNWTFTLGTGLTDPWANGATAIIYTGEKDPALWPRLIAETGATLFAGVPGVYRQMLKYAKPAPADFGVLRHGLMAGETPPPGLFEEWEARTGRPLYEALGMSEISTYVSSGPGVPRKPGAVGKAQAGRRLAVLPLDGGSEPLPSGEEGLLAVHRSDPGLMLGYWQRPQEERDVYRGDWFVGGDLAVIDAGRLRVPPRPRQRPDEGARLSRLAAGGRGGAGRTSRQSPRSPAPRSRCATTSASSPPSSWRIPGRATMPPTSSASPPSGSPPTSARAASSLSRRCRAPPTASSCARRLRLPDGFSTG